MSAVDDNDSGVNEEINLNDIDTDAKFRKLEKQADKAERDAIRAEKARKKTEAEVQKSADVLRQYEEREQHARTASPLHAMGGNIPSSDDVSSIGTPTDGSGTPLYSKRRGRDNSSQTPFGASQLSKADYLDLIYKNQQELKSQEQQLQQMRMQINGIKQQALGSMTQMQSMMRNPKGNIISMITGKSGIGRLALMGGLAGAVAYAVYEIGKAVFDSVSAMVMEQFKAGGIWDVRKLVRDEITVINNLRHMQDVEQGLVFFTSDTAETLRQGAPQNANTNELAYGHKQFNQMFNN